MNFCLQKMYMLEEKKILCLFHCRNIQKTIAVIRNESLMTIMSGQLICLFYFLLLQTLSQKMNSLLRKVQSNLPMWSPSIKQSPVLKGHIFLVLSQKILYELNLFQEVTCLISPLFLCPTGDLLIHGWLYIGLFIFLMGL